MKSIKTILIISLVLILAGVTLSMTAEGIVKRNLEEQLSLLMETQVEIDDVDLSLRKGSGAIQGLHIHNPEGYSDETAIYFEEAAMTLDLRSLFSEVIQVYTVEISEPRILVEQEGAGVNLRELNNTMSANASGGSDAESEKGLIIDKLVINQGSVTLTTNLDKQRTTNAEFERIELSGIGKAESGTVRQTLAQVLEPLINKALTKALSEGLMDQLKNQAKELIGG